MSVNNPSVLYADRMYRSLMAHVEAKKCPGGDPARCFKAAPDYDTTALCNIGKARAIQWEQAMAVVAQEARRGKADDETPEVTKPTTTATTPTRPTEARG